MQARGYGEHKGGMLPAAHCKMNAPPLPAKGPRHRFNFHGLPGTCVPDLSPHARCVVHGRRGTDGRHRSVYTSHEYEPFLYRKPRLMRLVCSVACCCTSAISVIQLYSCSVKHILDATAKYHIVAVLGIIQDSPWILRMIMIYFCCFVLSFEC